MEKFNYNIFKDKNKYEILMETVSSIEEVKYKSCCENVSKEFTGDMLKIFFDSIGYEITEKEFKETDSFKLYKGFLLGFIESKEIAILEKIQVISKLQNISADNIFIKRTLRTQIHNSDNSPELKLTLLGKLDFQNSPAKEIQR